MDQPARAVRPTASSTIRQRMAPRAEAPRGKKPWTVPPARAAMPAEANRRVAPEAGLCDDPLPEDGRPFEKILPFVRERAPTRPYANPHPRFFAFINASADPVGTIADYLASAMNPNCWGGDHAAIHVEDQVIRWLAEILGLPATAEGILTSGGSMANFTALGTARRAVAPGVREEGVAGGARLG